jgi:hypothetical protein
VPYLAQTSIGAMLWSCGRNLTFVGVTVPNAHGGVGVPPPLGKRSVCRTPSAVHLHCVLFEALQAAPVYRSAQLCLFHACCKALHAMTALCPVLLPRCVLLCCWFQIAFSSVSITLRHFVDDLASGKWHMHHGERKALRSGPIVGLNHNEQLACIVCCQTHFARHRAWCGSSKHMGMPGLGARPGSCIKACQGRLLANYQHVSWERRSAQTCVRYDCWYTLIMCVFASTVAPAGPAGPLHSASVSSGAALLVACRVRRRDPQKAGSSAE